MYGTGHGESCQDVESCLRNVARDNSRFCGCDYRLFTGSNIMMGVYRKGLGCGDGHMCSRVGAVGTSCAGEDAGQDAEHDTSSP